MEIKSKKKKKNLYFVVRIELIINIKCDIMMHGEIIARDKSFPSKCVDDIGIL